MEQSVERPLGEPISDSTVGRTNVREVLRNLFDVVLPKNTALDQDVVKVMQKHLGGESLQSRAGNSVAEELIALAKDRAQGGDSCGK